MGVMVFIFLCLRVSAQSQDELIKEFNKVMSFSAGEFVHFKMQSKARANAVIEARDTLMQFLEYTKKGDDIYFKGAENESLLQDSFLIQIDNVKKSIWFSKVEVATKKNISLMPLDNENVRELFTKKYLLKKDTLEKGLVQLTVKPVEEYSQAGNGFTFKLVYYEKNLVPKTMEILLTSAQKISEEEISALEAGGISTKGIIAQRDGFNFLEREQSMIYIFSDIQSGTQANLEIPKWTEFLRVNADFSEVVGLGKFSEYDVVKTF